MTAEAGSEDHRPTTVGLVDVSHSYGRTRALTSVSVTVSRGTTVLLGRNGAGKSTLSRILTGLEEPTGGSVARNGETLRTRPQWREHHARTGWLPQSLLAPMSMTVVQYLRYAAWLKGLSRLQREPAIEAALARADLVDQRGSLLKHLSGGTLRRAGIAQATVHGPSVLVLDEPTVGLDPEQRARFHQIIGDLSSDRCVLLSTHLLEDVEALAQRVLILDEGRIRFDGTVDELRAAGGDEDGSAQAQLRSGFLAVVRDRGP